ncbi:hypothetical protein AVEN_81272-1, partial [Araneus ventricosus]
ASECERKREEAERKEQKGMVGVMKYMCEEDGSFKKIQCHASTGFCYCVNPQTGEKTSDRSRDADLSCD